MEELRDDGFKYIGGIEVPGEGFSEVTTIYPEKRNQILSIGFKPNDGRPHNVYPVWLAPVNHELREWKVCFYNHESHDVVMNIYGVEK